MDVAQPDPLVGVTLGGRYRLDRMIGRGGAGAVYEATQEDLQRQVAIKTLLPELATDPTLLERFRREARTAAALGHPHIAQVYDWGDARPPLPAFIAFELVRGESLLDLLRREGRLTPQRAVQLMMQVLSALEVAHRAGVVHRDLKPGNLVVSHVPGLGESVKLLDFGIAQIKEGEAFQRLTRTGVVLGTPRYMAPEQISGDPIDARTDIWAAGVVLYRMLTGVFPFDGPPNIVLAAILREPMARIPPELSVPPAVVAILERALGKRRDERFETAGAMLEALANVGPSGGVPSTAVIGPAPQSMTVAAHETRAEPRTRTDTGASYTRDFPSPSFDRPAAARTAAPPRVVLPTTNTEIDPPRPAPLARPWWRGSPYFLGSMVLAAIAGGFLVAALIFVSFLVGGAALLEWAVTP